MEGEWEGEIQEVTAEEKTDINITDIEILETE